MQYSATTEALLHAIKNDVRNRVDDIVDYAENAAMTLTSENEVDAVLERALLAVEKTLAEAARERSTGSGCTSASRCSRHSLMLSIFTGASVFVPGSNRFSIRAILSHRAAHPGEGRPRCI